MATINIIPTDYVGNPQEALGYAWEDCLNKVPGIDVIKTGTWRETAQAKMSELGITKAHINCMWCGGFSGKLNMPEETPCQPAPATIEEVAYADHAAEVKTMEELDNENNHSIGWCNICHSYCFGDCEANTLDDNQGGQHGNHAGTLQI